MSIIAIALGSSIYNAESLLTTTGTTVRLKPTIVLWFDLASA